VADTAKASERILLVGCGDLGARIGVGLLAAGHQLTALTRRRQPPVGVVALHGDVGRAETLPTLPASIDRLIYVLTPAARTAEAYQLAYVTGLRHVLAALAPCRPRVTFISSTAVYADAAGGVVDETTPARPEAFNGQVMLAAEQLAAAAHADSLRLRLGGIYGPGHDHLLQAALAPTSWSSASSIISNRIHIDDAAAAVCHLIAGGHRGVFNIVDSEPASSAQVLAWLAAELTGSVAEPVTPPQQGRRISNQRLLESGFDLRYRSWREGYRALLEASQRPRPC